MKASGTTHALGMGRLDAPADDPLGISGTLRLAALVPGLHAIGVADPTKIIAVNPDHFKKAEADIAAGKVVALKAYTGYLSYGPDSPAYRPYIRLAARYKIPFIFHTGDTWSTRGKLRFAHPLLVDDVAVDHPDVKFVIAHFGNPWLTDAAEVVYKNDNVWADLSGILVGNAEAFKAGADGKPAADSAWASVLPDLRKAFRYTDKPDRFLYGTDWPLAPMAPYRAFVESFIPKDHHEAVFETNARQLFRIK
jgi:predicted TIM-barrel fold metal-dependent hydrolase